MKTQAFLTPAPSRGDRARLLLLEAAADRFGEVGPEGATLRDIARAAGQNIAAIAYYFGNKEKLYHAVLEAIVREIRHRLGSILEEIRATEDSGPLAPARARTLLARFLRTVYLGILSRNESAPIARLIVRELMQPTAGFDILYGQGFGQLHETLCRLTGAALGRDPESQEVIIRTHTLMGQVYFFAMSRAAILRRLGWKDLEGGNAELVAEIVDENLEVLLRGLRSRSTKCKS